VSKRLSRAAMMTNCVGNEVKSFSARITIVTLLSITSDLNQLFSLGLV